MEVNSNEECEMWELTVKVPARLLEEIDRLAADLNYASRSDFIRDVLQVTTEPILTPGANQGVSTGYADVASGRTMSISKARTRLELDTEE